MVFHICEKGNNVRVFILIPYLIAIFRFFLLHRKIYLLSLCVVNIGEYSVNLFLSKINLSNARNFFLVLVSKKGIEYVTNDIIFLVLLVPQSIGIEVYPKTPKYRKIVAMIFQTCGIFYQRLYYAIRHRGKYTCKKIIANMVKWPTQPVFSIR